MTNQEFVDACIDLEKRNILYRERNISWNNKSKNVVLKDIIKEKNILSKIDNNMYCVVNGSFERHLRENNISISEYLEKYENFHIYNRYRVNYFDKCVKFGYDKKYWIEIFGDEGKILFMKYRKIMSSMKEDYRNLMYFYDMKESEAISLSKESKNKRSISHLGEKNCSFGKKGIESNIYKKFKTNDNAKELVSFFYEKKIKNQILRWALENNINIVNYDELKRYYYSLIFQNIQKNKTLEIMSNDESLTFEQAQYLYNSEKSIKNYDPKNFYDFCIRQSKKLDKENKNIFDDLNKKNDYRGMLSFISFLNTGSGYGKKYKYVSEKFGEFILRSKLEKGALFILDRLKNVSSIKYEKIIVPYFDSIKNKNRKYYIDFDVLYNNKRFLIEVKPYNQCVLLDENEIKFKKEAADKYANNNSCIYLFITEKDMKYELFEKKLRSY